MGKEIKQCPFGGEPGNTRNAEPVGVESGGGAEASGWLGLRINRNQTFNLSSGSIGSSKRRLHAPHDAEAASDAPRAAPLYDIPKGNEPLRVCEHLPDPTAPGLIVNETLVVMIAVDDLILGQGR